MTQIQSRKRGIPALVYPASSSASPSPCSLLFKHSLERAQATLSLQFVLAISGYNEPQAITLPYDASNLLPSSLGPATIPLPQTRLDELARHGKPQIRTLSLRLKTPCRVWCPPGSGSLRPDRGAEDVMGQLTQVARATDVRVVFDFNWLRRQHHEIFAQLVEQPESLAAFATRRRDGSRCMDWTVFDLGSAEVVQKVLETESETEDEAPPSYIESHKRSRHTESPSSISPSRRAKKRVLLSPARMFTSPTEKASSVPPGQSPRSYISPADLQREVMNAVATFLPGVLRQVLSDLPEIRTTPASPSISVAASVSSQTSIPPPPLSSLNTPLDSRVARHVEAQLQSIYDHTLSHASYLRNAADAEMFEVLEDYKLDMNMIKDDALVELDREVVDKLEHFRADVADVVDEVGERVGERADELCDDVRERLDAIANTAKVGLQREQTELEREKKWLVWEREVLERDRRGFEKLTAQIERTTRAGSAPL
ncbi:hypothetical protein N0V95_005016 [Ascochyta clinopodiicola]|nr:hypothetical protein N0V95_005016 [Ascochyta clinopodiicola]